MLGIATFTVAATSVTYGFVAGGEHGWTAPLPLAGFAMLPVLAIWLQDGLGLRPLQAALVIAVQQVTMLLFSAAAGSRMARLPARWTVGGGTVVVGAGALALVAVALSPSWQAVLPGLMLIGIGAGIVSPVLPATAMSTAPEAQSGVVAGAANSARQLGLALGIALLGSVFHRYVSAGSGYVAGLCAVFAVAGGVGVVTGLVACWLLRARRQSPDVASPAEARHRSGRR